MFRQIKIDDRFEIFYTAFNVRLRCYHFEYLMHNGIKSGCDYTIYFIDVDNKAKFKVESFMEDDAYFDTFDDAETYIFKKFMDLKNKIIEQEKDIQDFTNTINRRKKGTKK